MVHVTVCSSNKSNTAYFPKVNHNWWCPAGRAAKAFLFTAYTIPHTLHLCQTDARVILCMLCLLSDWFWVRTRFLSSFLAASPPESLPSYTAVHHSWWWCKCTVVYSQIIRCEIERKSNSGLDQTNKTALDLTDKCSMHMFPLYEICIRSNCLLSFAYTTEAIVLYKGSRLY